MNRIYRSTIVLLALVICIPLISRADTDTDTTPPPSSPIPVPSKTIRTRILNDYTNRVQNMKDNENYRNHLLETQTTREAMPPASTTIPRMNMRSSSDMHLASSSPMNNRGIGKANSLRMLNFLPIRAFEARRKAITKQLDTALSNLKNIRARIDSRITKEQSSGNDMTDALSLLNTADGKISAAESAITSLENYIPAATSTANQVASTTVSLDQARTLAKDAQTALKDAKDSLKNVVVAIAKALGVTNPQTQ